MKHSFNLKNLVFKNNFKALLYHFNLTSFEFEILKFNLKKIDCFLSLPVNDDLDKYSNKKGNLLLSFFKKQMIFNKQTIVPFTVLNDFFLLNKVTLDSISINNSDYNKNILVRSLNIKKHRLLTQIQKILHATNFSSFQLISQTYINEHKLCLMYVNIYRHALIYKFFHYL